MGPLVPALNAAKNSGADDVLWLLDDHVLEMTNSNVFFLIQNRYS